ncbi:MAG: hypothetical protein HY804_12795, partial [Nitrospinae bacterium]|nr:hypothetical protein [Nitrospinota bacterium]
MTRGLGYTLAVFFMALAFMAAPAHAATFTVDDFNDVTDVAPGAGGCATAGGKCTLRAAIREANALFDADTIILPAGVYTLTIGGAGEEDGDTGDLDINNPVTIIGAGAGTTEINGNGI